MHCNALRCTDSASFIYPSQVLQHAASHYMQHAATHCSTLQLSATHCNTLQHTATSCNTLQHTATHACTSSSHVIQMLQHTAIYNNTQQHTATHCNTLNYTATHCFLLGQLRLVNQTGKTWKRVYMYIHANTHSMHAYFRETVQVMTRNSTSHD